MTSAKFSGFFWPLIPPLSAKSRSLPYCISIWRTPLPPPLYWRHLWMAPYGDEQEKALLINFNQGAKLHSSHLWSCHEHQYLYEFSYDDEQEIFCFFLWWWTRKRDIDKFQFLMAAKLHSWQRVTCLVMSRAIMTLLKTRNILLFLMVREYGCQ